MSKEIDKHLKTPLKQMQSLLDEVDRLAIIFLKLIS